MKKFNIRFAAVLMMGSLLAIGCGKENGPENNGNNDQTTPGKRLVKEIRISVEECWSNGEIVGNPIASAFRDGKTWEYVWSGNNLVKISRSDWGSPQTLNYTGDRLTSIPSENGELVLNYTGNLLTSSTYRNTVTTYQYDDDGNLIELSRINNDDDNPTPRTKTFTWSGGNMSSMTKEHDDGSHATYYEYDSKANAYSSFPKALLIAFDGELGFGWPSLSKNNPISNDGDPVIFEYDGDYPISMTTMKSTETGYEEYGYDSIVFYKIVFFEYEDGTGKVEIPE